MRAIVAAFAVGLGLSAAPAFADDPAPASEGSIYSALQQVPLTEEQIERYIDSLNDMQKAMGDAPADAAEPDAKTMAKLESIARTYGFKDFNDYNTIAGNVALVLDGVDPETKSYVGADKLIEKSIAEVNADKTMSEADRKTTLADLQAQLKAVLPIKFPGNIDLVVKHYDKLSGD
jgi:hypothetical protein